MALTTLLLFCCWRHLRQASGGGSFWPPYSAAGPRSGLSRLPTLGAVETGTILGLLNLLFLSFVLVQIRYFFGGAATIAATAGLTYTQYARSGFFQLVWVAALVLPLLLSLHTLQDRRNARALRLFSAQAAMQVALLL